MDGIIKKDVSANPSSATGASAAEEMLKAPNLIEQIGEDISAMGVIGEEDIAIGLYLVGTSRLLPKPLAAIVQGSSSSGKSHIVNIVASLFPSDEVILATQITPQALFYMPQDSLKHKFIVAGERSRRQDEEIADATRTLREMLSGGSISKLVTTQVKGNQETKHIKQDGPIAYVETTTLSNIFAEDKNRCILFRTDESPEQSRRIMIHTVLCRYTSSNNQEIQKAIIQKHHTMQKMIKAKEIFIPFADKLAEIFPTSQTDTRRAFSHLLNLIETSALLHQYQRPTDEHGRIIAQPEDYLLAIKILGKPIERILGKGINPGAIGLMKYIVEEKKLNTFKNSDLYEYSGLSEKTIRNYLYELKDAGFVGILIQANGQSPAVWEVKETDISKFQTLNLPPVDKVCLV
jgi:hypothetical protein